MHTNDVGWPTVGVKPFPDCSGREQYNKHGVNVHIAWPTLTICHSPLHSTAAPPHTGFPQSASWPLPAIPWLRWARLNPGTPPASQEARTAAQMETLEDATSCIWIPVPLPCGQATASIDAKSPHSRHALSEEASELALMPSNTFSYLCKLKDMPVQASLLACRAAAFTGYGKASRGNVPYSEAFGIVHAHALGPISKNFVVRFNDSNRQTPPQNLRSNHVACVMQSCRNCKPEGWDSHAYHAYHEMRSSYTHRRPSDPAPD
eukprot:387095-Pelagomonas_calceolata.AAC.4